MFEFHCNCCGYDFFIEEGYDNGTDTIICPICWTTCEKELGGKANE